MAVGNKRPGKGVKRTSKECGGSGQTVTGHSVNGCWYVKCPDCPKEWSGAPGKHQVPWHEKG